MLKELGQQNEHECADLFFLLHGYMFVFICIRMGAGWARKDVSSAEALQKAGQIMSGNPCIHVSALRVCCL